MSGRGCPRELEVARLARLPESTGGELREHARTCTVCRETLAVSRAMVALAAHGAATDVPAAGQVWWRAEIARRRAAAAEAERPLRVAEIVGPVGAAVTTGAWLLWKLPEIAAAFGRGVDGVGELTLGAMLLGVGVAFVVAALVLRPFLPR